MAIPTHPKLRWPLELRSERIEDQPVLLLRCPLGITDQPLFLISEVAPILSCFDGTWDIDQIVARFADFNLQRDTVVQLVTLLDAHLFLDSPSYHAANERIRSEFRLATVRAPALAGLSYANSAGELAEYIDQALAGNVTQTSAQRISAEQALVLVSPHIDYMRGSKTYGAAYRELRGSKHDLYLLVGTAHQYSERLFHLTTKDFKSPLGILHTERDFVGRLAAHYGIDRSFEDEFLHRREHSLELQLPFMQRVIDPQSRIVPILVGGFHKMVESGRAPSEFDEYESFAGGLAEEIARVRAEGGRVCIIAGVDMAHVGGAFGDTRKLTPEFMTQIEARDREYLQAISNADQRALFDHIAQDNDARRICGFPTMYLVLDLLERLAIRTRTEIFEYRQAVNYATDCAVTFAGVGMYEEARS